MEYQYARLPLRSYTRERRAEHTLDTWKIPGEAGSSVLPFKTAVHYHTQRKHSSHPQAASIHLICALMWRSLHHLSLSFSSRDLSVGCPRGKQGKGRNVRIYFRSQNTDVLEIREWHTWAVLETMPLGAEMQEAVQPLGGSTLHGVTEPCHGESTDRCKINK